MLPAHYLHFKTRARGARDRGWGHGSGWGLWLGVGCIAGGWRAHLGVRAVTCSGGAWLGVGARLGIGGSWLGMEGVPGEEGTAWGPEIASLAALYLIFEIGFLEELGAAVVS